MSVEDSRGPAEVGHVEQDERMRASDAEREAAVERLREHAAAGRIDVDELARRTDAALAAVTRSDLRALTADLPEGPRTRGPDDRPGMRHRSALHSSLAPYVAVSMMLVAIWALTGAGYFWPIWPILGWGLCVVPGRHRTGCGMRHGRYAHGHAPASSVWATAGRPSRRA